MWYTRKEEITLLVKIKTQYHRNYGKYMFPILHVWNRKQVNLLEINSLKVNTLEINSQNNKTPCDQWNND